MASSYGPGVPSLSRGLAFHGVGGYGWECGIFHSNVLSVFDAVFGSVMTTPEPVALTYPMSTSPASAVDHKRARGPPPVSSASRFRPSNHRGAITHVYLSSNFRFCGRGLV